MNNLDEIYNAIEEEAYEDYVPKARVPEKPSKANTYLQSVIETVEPLLRWTNETVEKDRSLLYMKFSQLAQKKADTGVKLMIEWARGKNLHVKQLVKAINKSLI